MTEEATHTYSHLFSLTSFPLLSTCLLCLSRTGLLVLLQTHTCSLLRTFVLWDSVFSSSPPGPSLTFFRSVFECSLLCKALPSYLLFPLHCFIFFLYQSYLYLTHCYRSLSDLVSYLSLPLQYQIHEDRDFCLFCSLWHSQHYAWFILQGQ